MPPEHDQTEGREVDVRIDLREEEEVAERKVTKFRLKLRKLEVRNKHKELPPSHEEDEHENSNIIKEEFAGEGEGCESHGATCPECGRFFRSMKSLFGHLRSHPDRDYRGWMKPPAPTPTSSSSSKRPADNHLITASHWQTKRARSRCDTNETKESDAGDEEMKEEFDANEMEVVQALLMLKSGVEPMSTEKKKKVKTNSPIRTCYNCNLCEKSFPTHQALGGHVASHNNNNNNNNKHKNNLEAEASNRNEDSSGMTAKAGSTTTTTKRGEHKCTECNHAPFLTGQALGGHMRRHFNQPRRGTEGYVEPPAAVPPPTASVVPPSMVNCRSNKGLGIDLNELPEDDESEM